jgi:putative flippase GtrA
MAADRQRPKGCAQPRRRGTGGSDKRNRMTVHDVDFTARAGKTRWLPGRWPVARRFVERLPRALRFIIVGCTGLAVDLSLFTALEAYAHHPLAVRLITLTLATFVTWRLNRAFTFARSHRPQHHEAMRYAAVTALAQGTSYLVFAALVLTVLAWLPQAALMSGALVGAFISYNGHRLFAFAPHAPAPASAAQGAHRA